jgi:hypothetical protein
MKHASLGEDMKGCGGGSTQDLSYLLGKFLLQLNYFILSNIKVDTM